MLLLFLSILGALAFTQAGGNSTHDSEGLVEHNNYATELPDVAPYNLMFPASTPGHVYYPDDPNNMEFVSITIRAAHKKARVVYKDDTKKEVVGIDMYIRGTPISMGHLEYNENFNKESSIIYTKPSDFSRPLVICRY